MMSRGRWWIVALGTCIVIAGAYLVFRPASADGEAYITATIERGSIRTSISATGTLQAVQTVQVGSQVTGRIQSLHADFNSIVKKGQVIARIDPATFDAALVRSRADLEDARAGVSTARADEVNQKANLEAAEATLQDAERVYRRTVELSKDGVASTRDLEAAEVARNEAEARRKQAQAQVTSAEAAIEQAVARVKQSEAQVDLAKVNLDYTVITSPVDGVVVSRNVDVGQTVAASLQAPTLFVIANDLTQMQVLANVDEADIGHIGADAQVAFTVDSFPGEFFKGTIDQIRLNPVVTQNVVTYSVIVSVENPELKLRPGMTANTTFTVAEAEDALRLPNAALRFWPADVPRDREQDLIRQALAGTRGQQGADAPSDDAPPSSAGGDAAGLAPAGRPHGVGAPAAARSDGSAAPLASSEGVLRFPQIRKMRWRPRVIWVKGEDGSPQPRVVHVGITDGSASEVKPDDLKESDSVIVGNNQGATAQNRPNNPLNPLGARPGAKAGGRRF